jgi:hypothetical protein
VIDTGTKADMKANTEDGRKVKVEENRKVEIEGTSVKASMGEEKGANIEEGKIKSTRIDFCSHAFK